MKEILSYRAMGLLCRQQAVFHPENSWKWLGQAERWEHLADAEIASHFRESNTASSSDLAKSGSHQTSVTRDGKRSPAPARRPEVQATPFFDGTPRRVHL
jgi:hypothetical protein